MSLNPRRTVGVTEKFDSSACGFWESFGLSALVSGLFSQVCRNLAKLLQRRLQVIDDFLGDDLRRGKVIAVGERLVLEPENVEARLVARDEFVVAVSAPAALHANLARL